MRRAEPFIRSIQLVEPVEGESREGFPWTLGAVAALANGLDLHPKVTYLIGDNGTGKSTVVEALAVAAGMNPEGGSSNFAFQTRDSHSDLWRSVRIVRGTRRPRTDFFLRAESLFTTATYLENLEDEPLKSYGGRSLHEQSHGESFLAVMLNRFGPDGLYLLDEPEAALSTQNCLTFLRRVHELVEDGSQFVIATHSPLVLAYPDAAIYEFDGDAMAAVDYEDSEPVRLTRSFLDGRERFLQALLRD
jgi:predicted ATPase